MRQVLLVIFAALVVAHPAHARETPATIVQDDGELLFRSDERVAEGMRQLRSLGVDRVRLTAGWSGIAPDPEGLLLPDLSLSDPDAYPRANWRRLDRAVRAAQDAGLEVMIDIAFWAPRWATTGNREGMTGRQRTNVDPAAFADFTEAVVRRYSGNFVPEPDPPAAAPTPPQRDPPDYQFLDGPLGWLFGGAHGPTPPPPAPPAVDLRPLPRVSWWTIWNEPNHAGFLQPQHTRTDSGLEPYSPHLYRRMVEAAHPRIKQLQPDSVVLVGGLAAFGVKDPGDPEHGIPPLKFVRELACVDERLLPLTADRCRDYRPLPGDGFAHHPYALRHRPAFRDPGHPDSARIGALDRLSNLLVKLARMGRVSPGIADLYLTEFGYESKPPDPGAPFGLAQQARFVNWAEYLAWKNPQVRSWPQFLLRDLPVVGAEPTTGGAATYSDYQTGLLFEDGTPKPAATSFRLALFAGCVKPAGASPRGSRPRPRAGGRGRTARRDRPGRQVLIWGHVRPGAAIHRVVLEQSRARSPRWRPARTAGAARARKRRGYSRRAFVTSAGGVFVRHAPWRRGTRYRLSLPGPPGRAESGLAVRPVGCSATRPGGTTRRAAR